MSEDERRFFADADPLGFILFARNVEDPAQVRDLCQALRETVGRDDAPILIDQEGGRVQRMRPPHWRAAPPAARFGDLHRRDAVLGIEAARLNARLLAHDLACAGISVDCAPVLDVPQPDAHDIIGDRAFDSEPSAVADLGRATMEGLLAGGVLPVIKHLPGHGRARADSHESLPRVAADANELAATDFAPFTALADAPWAMTAHVVYEAIDRERPATHSATVISETIRGDIGFAGVLVSDDIGMGALTGSFDRRAAECLTAGCDVVLHCSGDMAEMVETMQGVTALTHDAAERVAVAEHRRGSPEAIEPAAALARLDALLAEAAA